MKLSTDDLGVFFGPRHHELASRLRSAVAAVEAAGSDAEVARVMGEQGLYAELVPDGEAPVDVRSLCLVREMLAQVSPLADAIFAVQGLGSYPVLIAGNAEQRELLPGFRSGDAITGFALTEPEAGSDVASMQTVARAHSDGFVLDGEKTLISNVGIASHYVVFANANPSAGRKGITAFLVGKDAPGLTLAPIALNVDHPIGSLTMRGCRVGEGAMLGGVGDGFKIAMRTLDTFRVSVGAAAVGMARRALDAAIERVRGRVQFGKPLAEQQVVQSYIAQMATELDASRLLVLRAAHEKDSGRERVTVEAAMAKLFATEAAQRIIDHAVQLFGGRGVAKGEVVENLYRSIRPLRIYEGTTEIQRLIIGRELTKDAP